MNYTKAETDVIVADSIEDLNYKEKKLLLDSQNENNADREKYADALIKIVGDRVYNKIKEKFRDLKYRAGVLADLDKRRIECVTVLSGDYPFQLTETPVPPLVLYVRGNRKLLSDRLFGIVGSRKISSLSFETAKRISAQISERLTVVTGVADGGDSAAIAGALQTENIICVLPAGHDSDFAKNLSFLEGVEERGLTVSEFAPKTKAMPYTFTLRNRIIAGLCEGVLVVSAGEKSGALSTAGYAADYNRDVFAFPYSVGVTSGKGCNNLIKNGAYLCDCAEDVFSALGVNCGKNPESEDSSSADKGLDETERAVIKLLRERGELHAEKLAQTLDIKLTDLITVCSMLEIKGLIVRVGGNSFAAI